MEIPSGRQVRCAKCAEVWVPVSEVIKPPQDASDAVAAEEVSSSATEAPAEGNITGEAPPHHDFPEDADDTDVNPVADELPVDGADTQTDYGVAAQDDGLDAQNEPSDVPEYVSANDDQLADYSISSGSSAGSSVPPQPDVSAAFAHADDGEADATTSTFSNRFLKPAADAAPEVAPTPDLETVGQFDDASRMERELTAAASTSPQTSVAGRGVVVGLAILTACMIGTATAFAVFASDTVMAYFPGTRPIYEKIGALREPSAKFEIKNVRARWDDESGRPVLKVSGRVHAAEGVERRPPSLVFALKSQTGEVLFTWASKSEPARDTKGVYAFSETIPEPPQDVRRIRVRFGSPAALN